MPSTTAARIRKGSAKPGNATIKAQAIARGLARSVPAAPVRPAVHQMSAARASVSTSAGNRPPVNKAAIDTPVTEPIVISTSEGGIVSVIAPVEASSATSRPPLSPRAFIAGKSTGATAAMSAAFEPEMPETRYIAPRST